MSDAKTDCESGLLVPSVPPRKCVDCRERAVDPEQIPVYSTELHYEGCPYTITLANLDVRRCQKCGSMLLGDQACDRMYEALRGAAGILAPAEIRSGRERLGYDQDSFARMIGVSAPTLGRWENGCQLQSSEVDALLRRLFCNEAPVAVDPPLTPSSPPR